MGMTALLIKINCDNECLFLKQGTVTLGLHGDVVGGTYFPAAEILPEDFRGKDYIEQVKIYSREAYTTLMNYKDKIGNIKAILCNAVNPLAITPDLWVLLPVSM